MHLRKSLIVLAAMLVGFGLTGGGELHAATIKSVQITSPDSGSKVGIDSTFQVRVSVQDFFEQDSLEVVVYLGTADSTVLADTTNTGTYAADFGALSDVTVIRMAAKGLNTVSVTNPSRIKDDAGTGLDGAGYSQAGTNGVVAANTKRKRGNGATFKGDGDSLVTSVVTNDTTVFIWYGKLHASSNTVKGVKAAAFAIDPAGGSTTAVKLSTESIDVDGDRPANPSEFIASDGAGTSVAGTAHVPIDGGDASGELNVKSFNGVASNDHDVLAIGDTITTRVKIGTSGSSALGALLGSDTLKVVLDIFGKEKLVYQKGVVESPRSADTLKYVDVLTEGEYGNLDETWANSSVTDTLMYFVIDPAGNRSSATANDLVPVGVTAGTNLLFDTQRPKLDAQEDAAAGDTILPTSTDTISDGTDNTWTDDENLLTYSLADVLDSLVVEIGTQTFVVFNQKDAGNAPFINDPTLKAGTDMTVDFTQFGNTGASNKIDSLGIRDGATTTWIAESAAAGGGVTHANDTLITTGTYDIKFTPTDAAGNTGSTVTRTGVYVDVDDITLTRLFPTAASGLDTLEEASAQVVFKLSEPADSVTIKYFGIAGTDKDSSRTYSLVGGQLTETSSEQTFKVPGLVNSNKYLLSVEARDLAGNWTQSSADTFQYDTSFVVPVIANFTIDIADAQDGGNPIEAGDSVTLTITAKTSTKTAAVTYGNAATVTLAGAKGLKWVSGTGSSLNADGTIALNADDWVIGERTIVVKDTVAVDTITVSVVDNATASLKGTADSVIVVNPDVYSEIRVAAPDTVGQGDDFWVAVSLSDQFGNDRVKDNRFVEVSANKVGVTAPTAAIQISKGAGGFWANSSSWSGAGLVLTVRDIVEKTAAGVTSATGDDFIVGTDTIYVDGNGASVLDAPNTVVGADYKGASGSGDQGGFIILTFDASSDHSTLDGYRIYRDIAVSNGKDSTGAIVALAAPTTATVPWGVVDAVPGADVMHVVVATLDGDSTAYSVGAERGGLSSKQAFSGTEAIASPYDLMAQTMLKSKEAAEYVPGEPVFAQLTPEALEFDARGVAPRMKAVDGLEKSGLTRSNSVRAIDNIAPTQVASMRALDTPSDAGGSITVAWSKSIDDRMLTSTAAQAVGGQVYSTAGVEGYNVYRKIGEDNAYQLVGQEPAGATSFVDHTVFNGIRYTYQVKPYDTDNIADGTTAKTAMAIRNNVVDANGDVVRGLFGADNQVGFDDFFILADQIGVTAADEAFEPAFDLSPNNKIDLDDFFAFADNFGRAIEGSAKALPMLAGLNSDARFYLDAGTELPRIGEEMAIAVSLEDFVELKGYGLSVSYDPTALAYVGARIDNSILGTGEFADAQTVSQKDGLVSLAAYGDAATEGDLGLNLVFRSLREIEDSYVEITDAQVRDGSYGLNEVVTPVSVRIETRPEVYALRNNYPNPFNPETTIKYQLPEAGDVKLEIYNMLGQVVRTLVNQHQSAGRYTIQWNASNDYGQDLSSGIYFYRVQVGGEFTNVKKMLLVK